VFNLREADWLPRPLAEKQQTGSHAPRGSPRSINCFFLSQDSKGRYFPFLLSEPDLSADKHQFSQAHNFHERHQKLQYYSDLLCELESWSVRVSGNWRITYRFIGREIEIVNYEDYH